MKGFILWLLVIVFCGLSIKAFTMGEVEIGLVLGVLTFGCLWAAPGGESSGKKSKKDQGSLLPW